MKSLQEFRKYSVFGLIIFTTCFVASKAGGANFFQIPGGLGGNSVQFDGVLQLWSATSQSHVTLFVRYWVAPSFYEVAVVWAEPNGRGLNFPLYPIGLQIESEAKTFSLKHDIIRSANESFNRSEEIPEVFTNMFGDFTMGNVRFAEARHARTRISINDFHALWFQKDNAAINGIKRVDLLETNGLVKAFKLFNLDDKLCRSVDYFYGVGSNSSRLERQIVLLEEEVVTLKLPGSGAKVRTGSKTVQVQQFPSMDLKGGRKSEITYAPLTVDGKSYNIPETISVSTKSGTLLRMASLTNYQFVSFSATQARDAAAKFGGFSGEDYKYRILLDRYWEKNPSDISRDDGFEVRRLIDFYERSQSLKSTIGERIRRLNILMELHRIVGNEEKLLAHYSDYLQTLEEGGLIETALVGGQTAIDTLMIWGRYDAAKRLLEKWGQDAPRWRDFSILVRFAERENKKGNFATISPVLRKINSTSFPISTRFQLAAHRATALKGLLNLLATKTELSEVMNAQVEFTLRFSDSGSIKASLAEVVLQVDKLYGLIPNPTQAELALWKKIASPKQP